MAAEVGEDAEVSGLGNEQHPLPCSFRLSHPTKGCEVRALITGVTGQDGSYLAELLLEKGYEVHGLIRRSSTPSTARIQHLLGDGATPRAGLHLHHGDLGEPVGLVNLLRAVGPHEVYNLAAQSHVRISFDTPESTGDITGLGTIRLLEAIRSVDPGIRFYQASSSELFGATPPPQSEEAPFHPRSPYAVAKLYAYWATRNYREAYGMFAVNGILFNHESPRRGENFVTRKISLGAARIAAGLQEDLKLGNLSARRDWGYAPEFVEGMWRMLQTPEPRDVVLGTGTSYSVEDFTRFAFEHVGLDWSEHVRFDENQFRPSEVHDLVADSTLAQSTLGWKANVKTPELARIMVEADLAALP